MKKKGGLLNELEEKIQSNQNWLNHYELKIKSLENDNSQLDFEWRQSFKINLENLTNTKDLLNYRQSIIDKICNNNNYIDIAKPEDIELGTAYIRTVLKGNEVDNYEIEIIEQ